MTAAGCCLDRSRWPTERWRPRKTTPSSEFRRMSRSAWTLLRAGSAPQHVGEQSRHVHAGKSAAGGRRDPQREQRRHRGKHESGYHRHHGSGPGAAGRAAGHPGASTPPPTAWLVSQAPTGTVLQVTVVATNAAGTTNGLSYTWCPDTTTTNFVSSNSPTVWWTLPNVAGLQTMFVSVSDGLGGYCDREAGAGFDGPGECCLPEKSWIPMSCPSSAPPSASTDW